MPELLRLTKPDIPRAVEVLERAFATELLPATYFLPEAKRPAAAKAYVTLALYLGIRYGEVYATRDFEGIAVWLPPGTVPFRSGQVLQAVPLRVLLEFVRRTWRGLAALRATGEYIDNLHRQFVPFPHWYLQVLGVAPEHQGKGFSSRLIRPMLARFDRESLPCYLETQTEKNVAIYQRFGFRVRHNGISPDKGFPIMVMLREKDGAEK